MIKKRKKTKVKIKRKKVEDEDEAAENIENSLAFYPPKQPPRTTRRGLGDGDGMGGLGKGVLGQSQRS